MTRPCLLAIVLSVSLSSVPALAGCSDAPRSEGDGGSDGGDAAMDAAPPEDGGEDAEADDASAPSDGSPDARGRDAGGNDGGDDAGATDAGPDAGSGDAGDAGTCEGADLRYCESPSDCTPVSCTCSCNGCGGFDYETVVRSGCADEWYASRGCEAPTICLDVCCSPTTVTCVDNQCGATSGSTT